MDRFRSGVVVAVECAAPSPRCTASRKASPTAPSAVSAESSTQLEGRALGSAREKSWKSHSSISASMQLTTPAAQSRGRDVEREGGRAGERDLR